MRHVFVDTNIVIDFLADRKPFSEFAARLFNFSILGQVTLYISAVSYNNIYYILRQSFTGPETVKLLLEISDMAEITDVTKETIKYALQSEFKDFEDAVQYYSALNTSEIDVIVTRNTKDFKKSDIAIMTPEEVVKLLENTSR